MFMDVLFDGDPYLVILTAKVKRKMAHKRSIILRPAEKLLRELLLDCRNNIQESRVSSANLEMWITGGWVRDRLLGIPCSDIDIALSTMTGERFSHFLTEFLHKNEELYKKRATELKVPCAKFSGFHTTKKNLGKSKKLETAVEVYEEDSRTPEMEFGTAEEDAFRRDATVNALFFNLDTQEVVDLTQKGLDDMASCIIRTPLEPERTFLDDPLRVLRLIRISSKLGYTIDDETRKCMQDEKIHKALEAKVSRERIGIEVFKIMKQPNPQIAFSVILEANLYISIFVGSNRALLSRLRNKLPTQDETTPWPSTWALAYQTLDILLNHDTCPFGDMLRSENSENLWIMAAYSPIAGLQETLLKEAVEEATEAIKATSKVSKLLDSALRNLDSIRTIAQLASNLERTPSRSVVGMALRVWGPTWRSQVVYSYLAELVYEALPTLPAPTLPSKYDILVSNVIYKYNGLADFITRNGLTNADSLKPLLDGNAIMKLFSLKNGAIFLKRTIDALITWQFDHDGWGVDEAAVWLQSQKAELGIPLVGS
ncbi:putative poly(A) polymerase [Xylaria arbuscula]|nr:putative poly(A) polymerase [Xylaria arbuscula]